MFGQEQEIVEDSEPERVLQRSSQELAGNSSQILNHGLISSDIINLTDEEQDVLHIQTFPSERALNAPNLMVSDHRYELIPKDPPFFFDACSAVDGSSDEDEIIDLGRFAYSDSQPSMATTSSATPKAPLLMKLNRKPNTAKVRHKPHSIVDGLSDNHFAKLTKCVSCDARWTTRKTVGQKMKHIKSCAKKNGLTAETIRVAVLREIATTKAPAAVVVDSTEKEEERSCGSEAAPTTLLNNTVDAVVLGKGARRRLPKTVQYVTQTRDVILERAKDVLLHSAQVTECSDLPQMDTMDDDKGQLPSTQPFGRSTLACGRVSKSDLFAAASVDVATKSECQLESENSEYSFSETTTHRNGTLRQSQARSLYVGPSRREAKEKRDCNATGWNDMSGRLAGKETLAGLNDTSVEPSQKDEQWMRQSKSLILQDRNLHLSILHYEPIHFDVFRILAEANGLQTIKFKMLRGFLDREAIHYYGAEPQGSRIRTDRSL